MNPFEPFLSSHGGVVLDGGLATALEDRGHRLATSLWSAHLLFEQPDAISAVHLAYLRAGADCITTASYQASKPGFAAVGIDEAEGDRLLGLSSELALSAREHFLEERGEANRLPPLVAASIGPYGAYLADGSEYDGRYGVDAGTLDDFHRGRFGLLADSGVDLLACETIPSRLEADVLLSLLDEYPDRWAWLSFSCADGSRLWDGSDFVEVVAACDEHERVSAVGVNCTEPRHVPELIRRAREVTSLPLIAYPNSGESYDATGKVWVGSSAADEWMESVMEAHAAGAQIIGGCCRVGPELVAQLRRRIDHRD